MAIRRQNRERKKGFAEVKNSSIFAPTKQRTISLFFKIVHSIYFKSPYGQRFGLFLLRFI